MHCFTEAKSVIINKNYDYLDQRNNEFDADFEEFTSRTDILKSYIGNSIEKNFANVWETPQGIKFLTQFEKVCKFYLALYIHCVIISFTIG